MIIRITVQIEAEAPDGAQGSYGSMNFSEHATLKGKHFSAVAAVFSRVHDLLEQIKKEFA